MNKIYAGAKPYYMADGGRRRGILSGYDRKTIERWVTKYWPDATIQVTTEPAFRARIRVMNSIAGRVR